MSVDDYIYIYIYIYIYTHPYLKTSIFVKAFLMVIYVENGHNNPSSIPGQGLFAFHIVLKPLEWVNSRTD